VLGVLHAIQKICKNVYIFACNSNLSWKTFSILICIQGCSVNNKEVDCHLKLTLLPENSDLANYAKTEVEKYRKLRLLMFEANSPFKIQSHPPMYSDTGSIRDDPHWTSRENSLVTLDQ
jgi:hypothetical protein